MQWTLLPPLSRTVSPAIPGGKGPGVFLLLVGSEALISMGSGEVSAPVPQRDLSLASQTLEPRLPPHGGTLAEFLSLSGPL